MAYLPARLSRKSRFSEWLLLHHPLFWRLQPERAVMVVLAAWFWYYLLAIGLVDFLVEPVLFSHAGDVLGNEARSILGSVVGFVCWISWYRLRTHFSSDAIYWRKYLQGPVLVDVAVWLALFVPPVWPQLQRPSDPETWSDGFLYLTALIWIQVTFLAWIVDRIGILATRSDIHRFFLWVRWDIGLPGPWRVRAADHETQLAMRHPVRWCFRLHRFLVVMVYPLILLAVVHGASEVFDFSSGIVLSLTLYAVLFLLIYRIGQTALNPIPQLYSSAWRWVWLQAVVTVGLVYAFLLLCLMGTGQVRVEWASLFGSAACLVWPALWLAFLLPCVVAASRSVLLSCFAVGLGAAFVPHFLPGPWQAALAALWCLAAIYLMFPRSFGDIEWKVFTAFLLLASATGLMFVFIIDRMETRDQAWQALALNAALVLVLRAGALRVIRLGGFAPRSG